MKLRPAQQKVFDDSLAILKRDGTSDLLSIKRAIKECAKKHGLDQDTLSEMWNTLPRLIQKSLSSPE